MSSPFETNLLDVQNRIEAACKKIGRDDRPTVVAVSKRQPDERIEQALIAGHRVFGENRVQEAFEHWAHRRETYPDLHLRLIGPLQTNKSEEAVALFDAIDVLDRPKLARTLADAIQKLGKSPDILVQVNTGEEPQKSGVLPNELDAFLTKTCPEFGITPTGLMCIPPAGAVVGPHFGLLKKLAERYDLKELSMGMSGDFDTAALFGATHVRVGSALFGERPT